MTENYKLNLPAQFTENIAGLHGAKGKRWLADLPLVLAEASRKWNLSVEKSFPNLTFNFVAACLDETGEKAVLKIGVPEENPPIMQEKNTLEAFGGAGAVKVFKFDENLCAMLLERAVPGKTLREKFLPESPQALQAAIDVMKKLPRQPLNKTNFPTLESWTNDLVKARKTDFASPRIEKAHRIFADLRQPFDSQVLLHGDVHFDNILTAKRAPFLLIDPKGCVGEIGYEIAVFLNDLVGWTIHLPSRETVLAHAVEQFSENFDLDKKEIYCWSFAQSILAAWWMFEDFGRDWENYMTCAKMWEEKGI